MKLQRYIVLLMCVGVIGTHLTGFSSYMDAFSVPNVGKLLVQLSAVAIAYGTKSAEHEAELEDAKAGLGHPPAQV